MEVYQDQGYLCTSREVAGRVHYSPGSTVELATVILDTLVVPGDRVPVRIWPGDVLSAAYWNRLITAPGNAAICGTTQTARGVFAVACTLELRSISEAPTVGEELRLVTIARQRCRILEVPKLAHGVLLATVQILDDELPMLPSLVTLQGAHMHPHFWRIHTPAWLADRLWSAADAAGIVKSSPAARAAGVVAGSRRPADTLAHAAETCEHLSAHPLWRTVAIDEAAFSFFIARNLPIPPETRAQLLAENNTVSRLRRCIAVLKALRTNPTLCCTHCGAVIVQSLASSSLRGLTAEGMPVFSNPHGISFRVLLVRELCAGAARPPSGGGGPPDLADTWYSGYGWTLLHCARCRSHLGWRYDWMGGLGALRSSGIRGVWWDTTRAQWMTATERTPLSLAAEVDAPETAERESGAPDHEQALSARDASAAHAMRVHEIPLDEALRPGPPLPGQPRTFFGLHSGAVSAAVTNPVTH
jgi:hypothetical protein